MTIVVPMTIAAAMLAVAMGEAIAQQGTAQPSAQSLPLPAPVGHRQPRLSDLPPDLARAERSGELSKSEPTPSGEPANAAAGPAGNNAAARTIDDRLRICRGC
jgi:hypothetical protein